MDGQHNDELHAHLDRIEEGVREVHEDVERLEDRVVGSQQEPQQAQAQTSPEATATGDTNQAQQAQPAQAANQQQQAQPNQVQNQTGTQPNQQATQARTQAQAGTPTDAARDVQENADQRGTNPPQPNP